MDGPWAIKIVLMQPSEWFEFETPSIEHVISVRTTIHIHHHHQHGMKRKHLINIIKIENYK